MNLLKGAFDGTDVYLTIEDPNKSGSFVPIGGQISHSETLTNSLVDITNKIGCPSFREMLPDEGLQEITYAVELRFNSEGAFKLLRAMAGDKSLHSFQVWADLEPVRFVNLMVQTFAETSPDGDSLTASVNLLSSNAFSWDGGFPPILQQALVWMNEDTLDEPHYMLSDGIAGSYASTPDSYANTIVQSITVEADCAADDWGGGSAAMIAKWESGDVAFFLRTGVGTIQLELSVDGVNRISVSSSNHGFVNGERHVVRASWNATTRIVNFFADGAPLGVLTPSIDIPSIHASTTSINVAAMNLGNTNTFAGKVYSAKMYKGIPGSPIDPYVLFDGASGTYGSTPDTVENSIRAEISARVDLQLDLYDTAGQTFIAKQDSADAQRAWSFSVLSSGALSISINETGATAQVLSSANLNLVNGDRYLLGFDWSPTNDTVTFLVNGVVAQVVASTYKTLFDSSANVTMASVNEGGTNLMTGIIYDIKVYKGIPGAPVDAYVRFNGVTGTEVTTPDSVPLSITGDIDIECDVALDDWSPADFAALVGKFDDAVVGNRNYLLSISTGGNLQLLWSPDGTSGNQLSVVSTVTNTIPNGDRVKIRATLDVDNGAGGHDVTFYVDGVQLGGVVTGVGVTNLFDSNSAVEIGARFGGGSWNVLGTIYGATIKDGIGGTQVLDMNPNPYIQGDPTFVGGEGNVFTLQGAAVAVSPIDDGLKIHMDPYPVLQGGATFPLNDASVPVAVLPGVAGDYFSEPSSVLNTITGSIVLEWEGTLDQWSGSGVAQAVIAKSLNTGNQRAYFFNATTGGALALQLSADGASNIAVTSSELHGFVDGTRHKIRAEWDQSTQETTFFADGVELGVPQSQILASIFASTADITVGGFNNGTTNLVAGTCMSAQVLDGIGGTLAVDFDPTNSLIGWSINGAAYVDQAWSLKGAALGNSFIDDGLKVSFAAADYDEEGDTWDSVLTGEEWTKFGGTSIVDTIKWLNQGTGLFPYDLTTIIGPAENLTVLPNNTARLPGDGAADNISTPDSAQNTIVGDIDVRVEMAPDQWIPDINIIPFSKGLVAPNVAWWIDVTSTDGFIRLIWTEDGSALKVSTSTVATGFTDGTRHWIRATLDVDNGAGGRTTTFYTSENGINWTVLGAPIVVAAVTFIFDTTDPVRISGSNGNPYIGALSRATAWDGVSTLFNVDFDPSKYNNRSTFTSGGAVWTLNGDTHINTTGQPVVNSAGGISFETTVEQDVPTPVTMVVVGKFNTAIPVLNQWLIGPKDDTAKNVGFWVRNSFDDRFTLSESGGGLTLAAGENYDTGIHVFTGIANSDSTSEIQVSGVGSAVGDAGASAFYGSMGLFSDGPNSARAIAWLGEVILFQGNISTAELIEVQEYLEAKWLNPIDIAKLLAEALAHFDETTIVAASAVTAWNNKGLGGAVYNLDTIVGTAGNLTKMGNGVARLPGVSGDSFETPDSVLNSVTGDIDMRWEGVVDVYGNLQILISKDQFSTTRSYLMQVSATGTLSLTLSADGTASVNAAMAPLIPLVDGQFYKLRYTWTVVSQEFNAYVDDVLQGTEALVIAGINDSSSIVEIGAFRNNNNSNLAGYTNSAQVYDGIYNGGVPGALGPDIATNGNFATNSDWTLGLNWSIGSGVASAANANDMGQDMGMIQGSFYEVTFTILNYVSGDVRLITGSIQGPDLSGNGTFVETIQADTATLTFRGNGDFFGDIDNVSVKEIIPELAVNFDPAQALAPQTPWEDKETLAIWTPTGDAFVNTSEQDVVNSSGLVALRPALTTTIAGQTTEFIVAKLTQKAITNQHTLTDEKFSNNSRHSFRVTGNDFYSLSQGGVSLLSVPTDDAEPRVWTGQFNGDATSRLRVADIVDVEGDMGAQSFGFATLFATRGDTLHLNGWISEYLIFDKTLTELEVQAIQEFLFDKWINETPPLNSFGNDFSDDFA